MPAKEIALELAAFLDSEPARKLAKPSAKNVRRIAEAVLTVCYDELGKQPQLLDGADLREMLSTSLPRRLRPRDRVAEHVPGVLAAMVDHLETAHVMGQAFEVRLALLDAAPAFVERVRSGANAGEQVVETQAPFVHRASKLGRNDPCSCGSGKKYKHCHGRSG